jgi:uncharacterized damage-inducible protein DinB
MPMAIKDALLPEFDHEMGTTRRLLERLPDDKLAWRPHSRSMTLGRLATHLAELPSWTQTVIKDSVFEIKPGEYKPSELGTRVEILALFDEKVSAARALIQSTGDGEMMATWTLRSEGHDVFTLPKAAVLRSFVMNHAVHHRGQLSVFLRLQDVPIPPIYGPSADEGG